jgi:bud site selection protein 31
LEEALKAVAKSKLENHQSRHPMNLINNTLYLTLFPPLKLPPPSPSTLSLQEPKPSHHLIHHISFPPTLPPTATMPPVRSARTRKPPPVGFSDIEDTLLEYANKMKDAENAPHEGKKRAETLWPIFQVAHQRSRYIYDLYYEKEAISKTLYEWLLKNGYADGQLIAKWKKQGYEKVMFFFLYTTWSLCGCAD